MHILPFFPDTHLFKVPDYFANITAQPLPGGLRAFPQASSDDGFLQLIQHLHAHGYRQRNPSDPWVDTCDFSIITGSVEEHVDGLGLVAICLAGTLGPVHCAADYYSDDYNHTAQLLTRSGTASLTEGSVVVFNSDVKHAWLSGHRCVLATVHVAKPRRR